MKADHLLTCFAICRLAFWFEQAAAKLSSAAIGFHWLRGQRARQRSKAKGEAARSKADCLVAPLAKTFRGRRA